MNLYALERMGPVVESLGPKGLLDGGPLVQTLLPAIANNMAASNKQVGLPPSLLSRGASLPMTARVTHSLMGRWPADVIASVWCCCRCCSCLVG